MGGCGHAMLGILIGKRPLDFVAFPEGTMKTFCFFFAWCLFCIEHMGSGDAWQGLRMSLLSQHSMRMVRTIGTSSLFN